MSDIASTEAQILGVQLQAVKESVDQVKDTLVGVNETLKTLVRVEWRQEEHARLISEARVDLDDHELRIAAHERELPPLKETRGWIIAGVLGLFALTFAGFMSGNLVLHPAQAPAQTKAAP